jgi:hypothetical protein
MYLIVETNTIYFGNKINSNALFFNNCNIIVTALLLFSQIHGVLSKLTKLSFIYITDLSTPALFQI